MKKIVFTLIWLIAVPFVHAEQDCSKEIMSQAVDACFVANKDATEIVLNKEYVAAKKRIADEYKSHEDSQQALLKNLLDTQRSWLKYRDGQCKMEASLAEETSSVYQGIISNCVERLDKQRIQQFKEMPYG